MQACLQILEKENGARIKEGTAEVIISTDQGSQNNQAYAPVPEFGEGPDPLQYTVEE
jgi:hypothetical protein